MSISSGVAPLSAMERLQRTATLPGASQATSATAATQPATPAAAAAQAGQGAAAVQPAAQAEVYNAPMLDLPANPTTRDVMSGLTRAMADPTVNDYSIKLLYERHEQLLNAERAMIQSIIDGMLV